MSRARIVGTDYQKLAMQNAIGEYRAFLQSLADPQLSPKRVSGVIRVHARGLLKRHAASQDEYVTEPPTFRPRPEPVVRAGLQCETCLRGTTFAEVSSRPFTNPGRCRCGGSLRAIKAPA